MTVATVNDKVQLQQVRTWFDPLDMFRQIAPDGVVKKEAKSSSLSPSEALDGSDDSRADSRLPLNPHGTGTGHGEGQQGSCPFASSAD